MVALESKGREGVAGYVEQAGWAGAALTVCDLADPSTPAVELMPREGTVAQRAAEFTATMRYAFGEASIGPASALALNYIVGLSLLASLADFATAGVDGSGWLGAARVLFGLQGDQAGLSLFQAMVARCAAMPAGDPGRLPLADALGRAEVMYGAKVTPAQRKALQAAPMSKIDLLSRTPQVASWFSDRRKRAPWSALLESNSAVVVNTGSPVSGGAMVDDDITAAVSAMLMFTLRRAIQTTCDGWQAAGRTVGVFSDELSLLAGSDSGVVGWLRNQGRAFGVDLVLATQYPQLLDPALRTAVMGFGTVGFFKQGDAAVVDEIVRRLSMDGSEWTAADMVGLPPYHAVLQASAGQVRQPACVVSTLRFDSAAQFFQANGLPAPQPADAGGQSEEVKQ